MSRLQAGGLVDRDRLLKFTFDGHSYAGFAADTLASALVANDVKLVGRSFKYHRPRGLLTAGSEEPNALVELRTQGRREPNTRATTTELFDGLVASSQNRWPSLAFDFLALNQLFSSGVVTFVADLLVLMGSAVLESVGIADILTKSLRTTNPHNVIKATFDALLQLKDAASVAEMRSKTVEDLRAIPWVFSWSLARISG